MCLGAVLLEANDGIIIINFEAKMEMKKMRMERVSISCLAIMGISTAID